MNIWGSGGVSYVVWPPLLIGGALRLPLHSRSAGVSPAASYQCCKRRSATASPPSGRHFPSKGMKVATSRPKWQPIKSYFAGQEMATEVRSWDPPPEAVGANGNRVGREPMRTRHAAWQAAVERVFTLRGGDTAVRPEGDHHGTAGSLGRGARGKLEGQT